MHHDKGPVVQASALEPAGRGRAAYRSTAAGSQSDTLEPQGHTSLACRCPRGLSCSKSSAPGRTRPRPHSYLLLSRETPCCRRQAATHQPSLPPARSRPALPAARRTTVLPTSCAAACGTSATASARGTHGRPRWSRAGARCASANSAPGPTPWTPLRRGAAAAASSWPSTPQGGLPACACAAV